MTLMICTQRSLSQNHPGIKCRQHAHISHTLLFKSDIILILINEGGVLSWKYIQILGTEEIN